MIKKRSKFSKWLETTKYKIKGRKDRRIPFWFEVHLIDSCNLNCAGCVHFSPLAEKDSVYDRVKFKNDLTRIYELFGDDAKQLHLMGGEPLTCPNINEYLRTARECLPHADLELITNAILLTSMPDDFFETCANNNIKISVSTYPIKLDYDEIFNFVKGKGVNIEIFNIRTANNVWKNMGLSRDSELDYKKTFLECKYANNCCNMRDGIVYFCPHAAYIHLFNKYFNEKYDNKNSGISIYEHTKEEILDFLRTPNEFCKYCHINEKKNPRTSWSVSKKEKSEWTKNY